MRIVFAVLSSMLVAVACASPFGGGGASDGLVSSSLEDLPQVSADGQFEIRIADFDAGAQLLGLDGELVENRVRTLAFPSPRGEGGPGFVFAVPEILRTAPDDESLEADAGFVLDDVQRSAEVFAPPHQASVIVGPAAWGGAAEPYVDGLLTLGQGEDLASNLENRSSLDPLGRPVRLAEADGVLGASFSTSVMQGWVDGTGARYSDNEQLVSIAAELDRHDVVSAVLFVGYTFSAPLPVPSLDESLDEFRERIEESGGLPFIAQPFLSVGIGNTIRDGQAIEVVSYRFLTDESAELAMPSIENVWTNVEIASRGELISTIAVFDSIERNGAVVTVVVVVPDDRVGQARTMLYSRDATFAYG